MTETIREQILSDVETSLLLINGSGVYYHTVGTGHIYRADVAMTQIDIGPYPLLAIAGLDSRAQTGSEAGAATYWIEELDIEIGGWIEDQTNTERDLSRLEADIRHALWTDYTRGGLAIDTLWRRTEVVHPLTTRERALVVCYFTITYEVQLSDLTSTIP